ncbi:MAG TPA: hypothetical protein VHG91_05915 [Longimicrobium sp.]|nr:hypothetical protein [Longimicrobium sp.]
MRGERIEAAGPAASVSAGGATVVDLPGTTLMPGMIEGHSHLFLHPYDETSWDDQVLREWEALRVARATVHARSTLLAGFTSAFGSGARDGPARGGKHHNSGAPGGAGPHPGGAP